MSALFVVVLVLVGLAALVVMVGTFIPREHSVSVRARYARPPGEVWKVLTDVEAIPTWRPSIRSVQRKHDVDGKPVWVERLRRFDLPLEVTEWVPEKRMVASIADDAGKLPFGGTWTWTLREVPDGTEVTLTENGFVDQPLFRVVAHFVLGHSRSMESYLRDLGTRFGETTAPRVV
jgi:uncharacterized protein YndB with AHSA1/START domain